MTQSRCCNRKGAECIWHIQNTLLHGHGTMTPVYSFVLQTGDGRISLKEFREMADSKGDLTLEGMFD